MADYAPSVYQIDGEFSFSLNKKHKSNLENDKCNTCPFWTNLKRNEITVMFFDLMMIG